MHLTDSEDEQIFDEDSRTGVGARRYWEEAYWLPFPSLKSVLVALVLSLILFEVVDRHEPPDLSNMTIDGVSTNATLGEMKERLSANDYSVSTGNGFVSYSAKQEDVRPEYLLFCSDSRDVPADTVLRSISGCSLRSGDFFIEEGDPMDAVWRKFPTAKMYEESTSSGVLVVTEEASCLFYDGVSNSVSRIGFERRH